MSEQRMKKPELVAAETLLALATNDTVEAAAQELGITRAAVYKRIRKYELIDKLTEIRQNAVTELTIGGVKAAKNLVAKVDSQLDDISIKASTEILDRIGVNKPTNNGATVNLNFNNHVEEKKALYDL